VLANLGVELEKYEFAVSNSEMTSTLTTKIKLKGGAKDRFVIKKTPHSNAETLAKIPGGLELDSLGKEGGWIKVRLIDGKIGYVYKKYIK